MAIEDVQIQPVAFMSDNDKGWGDGATQLVSVKQGRVARGINRVNARPIFCHGPDHDTPAVSKGDTIH